MMKVLLGFNALFELAAAAVFLFAPFVMLPEAGLNEESRVLVVAAARNFGFAALAIAGLSILMIIRPLSGELRFLGAGTLAFFHLGLTLGQFLSNIEGLVPLPVVLVHAGFAIIFLGIFIWHWREEY
jgi:hypothetical protein